VALCQSIPPLVSLAIGARLVVRDGLLKRPQLAMMKCVMVEALPYFVERLCFSLYTAITPTMVAALSVPAEASYYSIGDRIGAFLGTIPTPLFQAAVPYLSRKLRGGSGEWRLPLALVAGITSIVGVVAALTYLVCDPVISRFFSQDFRPAIPVAHLFCISSAISVVGMSLANFVIIPKNEARIMIRSSTAALAAGVAVQFIAIPHFGALGAVVARCTSECVVAVVLGCFVARLFTSERHMPLRAAAVPVTVDL
jgi:O-antigen/teichoic acid export membrane protein